MSNCVDNELYCSGCGVCFTVCPTNAISIDMNKDGFYSAKLDQNKCTNCEKCLKICTKFEINYPKLKNFTELPLYAGWSLDKTVQYETSSGGIGFEIAKWAINNNYKVAGVIYDVTEEQAKTVIATSLKEIELLKGSKYLQSFCADTFKQMINSKDKFVIFGTPCQIAGLRMLAKENKCENRLILIDFFCHGVPTYLLWQSFLKWLKEKKNVNQIHNIQFRNKKYGWHNFTMQVKTQTQPYYLKTKNNPFYNLFFSDFLLNDECYLCKTKSSFDFADIRLGDFWGSAFDNREDGISAISVCTNAGKNILDELKTDKKIILLPKEHDICIKNQSSLKKSYSNPPYKEKQLLMNLLKNKIDISKISKEYSKMLPFKKRIFLIIKRLIPNYAMIKFRKFYHCYKEN